MSPKVNQGDATQTDFFDKIEAYKRIGRNKLDEFKQFVISRITSPETQEKLIWWRVLSTTYQEAEASFDRDVTACTQLVQQATCVTSVCNAANIILGATECKQLANDFIHHDKELDIHQDPNQLELKLEASKIKRIAGKRLDEFKDYLISVITSKKNKEEWYALFDEAFKEDGILSTEMTVKFENFLTSRVEEIKNAENSATALLVAKQSLLSGSDPSDLIMYQYLNEDQNNYASSELHISDGQLDFDRQLGDT